MPVTIHPASHPARKWLCHAPAASASDSLLKGACPSEYERFKWMIRSSFNEFEASKPIHASSNGFVNAVVGAYSLHNHLALRPEDIWFAILTQLSFYVNANAEELRDFFVAHNGKKHLVIYGGGNIHTADFTGMAFQMTDLMQKNIVNPELKVWVMPDFTTTKEDDRVTAAVLMIGSLQKYFTYEFRLRCGIPSVTLLGEKEDWVKIRQRIDFLPLLGKESEWFANLLRVVLDKFIKTFEDPSSEDVVNFWSRVAHQSSGSGINFLSGWITAFCFWNEKGKCLYNPDEPVHVNPIDSLDKAINLDGVQFHKIDSLKIPPGFASVPVKVDDNGKVYWTRMTAGSVAIQARSSGKPIDGSRLHGLAFSPRIERNTGFDSIQPVSGWFMYEDNSPEKEVGDDEVSNVDLPDEEMSRHMKAIHDLLKEVDAIQQT